MSGLNFDRGALEFVSRLCHDDEPNVSALRRPAGNSEAALQETARMAATPGDFDTVGQLETSKRDPIAGEK
jgi:hypothetical protein